MSLSFVCRLQVRDLHNMFDSVRYDLVHYEVVQKTLPCGNLSHKPQHCFQCMAGHGMRRSASGGRAAEALQQAPGAGAVRDYLTKASLNAYDREEEHERDKDQAGLRMLVCCSGLACSTTGHHSSRRCAELSMQFGRRPCDQGLGRNAAAETLHRRF